ncbi:hypothetical protein I4U23_003170 [Adineta vaga]|nr:hypothetical protein I4U23_003170 [Adineta vaga]
MSSTIFSQENSSTVQTRRTPTRNDDIENNTQREKNHRSLSGKFRNLFRKSSASPNRHSTNERISSPQPTTTTTTTTTRQQSTSPEPFRTSTESPLLRAPLVDWSFGKKKTRSPSETKPKKSRKSKKKSLPSIEATAPVHTVEFETSTNGHTFVPRTPEPAHGGAMGRTQSSSSYETATRGFRDYTIIDNSKPSQQVITSNVDVITPPLYTSDLRRSPILDHQNIHYGNIDYSRHYDTSVPSSGNRTISNLEIIPGPAPQRQVNSTLQNLVNNTPTLPQTAVYPSSGTFTTNSNQWKVESTTSLDDSTDFRQDPSPAKLMYQNYIHPRYHLIIEQVKQNLNQLIHICIRMKPIIHHRL